MNRKFLGTPLMILLPLAGGLIWTGLACDQEAVMKFTLDSEAFAPGAMIPTKHTGDGIDVSPPLSWSNLPAGTEELALIMDDPDAPTAEPWVHWMIYKIPAETPDLPEGVKTRAQLETPIGILQGLNSWNTMGYRGPAPPPGAVHHYHFKLYALGAPLDVEAGMDKPALLKAIKGHVLEEAELVGTYKR